MWVALAALWAVALAGAVMVVGSGRGPSSLDAHLAGKPANAPTEIPDVQRPRRPENAPGPALLTPAPPLYVEIPAIGVRSDLEALGMGEDGTLQVPTTYETAGWFAAGTQPGQPGPAVIAGHVDSTAGPAVFYQLDQLVAGDVILVGREDGVVVHFVVTDVQRHPKDAFPADAVYGPVPRAELRLITCDGAFDRSAGSYRDNLVVFAIAADTPALAPGG